MLSSEATLFFLQFSDLKKYFLGQLQNILYQAMYLHNESYSCFSCNILAVKLFLVLGSWSTINFYSTDLKII